MEQLRAYTFPNGTSRKRGRKDVDTRLRTHCGSQKMTVAAMQMADMKVWAHRS